ncbi:TPA: hypothetical protein ACPSKE_000150 [Legionella feeleii]|uniref:Uncharacterized protein n=1 Tax=Legionella feeleii TaxID=453 RepID=A0A378J1P7_9GAMM|nr:hypothetical protein [Legionella feeleii]STX38214.1 Uncharacterised protein [Legionella feeleii]
MKNISLLGSLITGLSNTVTTKKDALKNYGKKTIHPTAQVIQCKKLNSLLQELEIEQDLRAKIMEKTKNSKVVDDFSRAIKILSCLKAHGLKGYSANEFLKGAHFKIKDGGTLYRELAKIEGAQVRFSSHFASTKVGKEMGINCGRILPEVLFLQSTQVQGSNFSHFQAEASPWRMDKSSPWTLLPNRETLQTSEHLTDSAYYFINKKISEWLSKPVLNLGPYGWSIHNDANPITSYDYAGPTDIEDLGDLGDLDELANALTHPVGDVLDEIEDNEFKPTMG